MSTSLEAFYIRVRMVSLPSLCLTFFQLPALIIPLSLTLSPSLSLGSFGSHWAVEPLSPVGRHSLLPAHCCPCRAHLCAGTSTLSYTKGTTSLHSEEQLQTSRSEYYEAWEPGGAPGLV